MEADDSADVAISSAQKCLQEGAHISNNADELQNAALGVSSEVDIALAYTSEKLANIENLLLHILAGESNIRPMDVENDGISVESVEKALTFDLLYVLLNSELRELDNSMNDLQNRNVDALRKMSTCEHLTEVPIGLVSKLHDSEELLKQSRERVLDMKLQLAKLKMVSLSSQQHEWRIGLVTDIKEENPLASAEWKPEIRTIEERRMLRMLEKSLAKELEQEKKLVEHRQSEEDLKLKIHLVEQVAAFMEEAAEVAWGRFLEADNTAEILMGISTEMLAKLQIGNSNLSSSTYREVEMTCKLQDFANQLNTKETLICTLNGHIADLMTDNAEVTSLREKVQMLEEKLKITESRLEEANASNQTCQQQLKEMECEIETLRENLFVMERRAESAEEKTSHLTDSNVELTEELDFLKSSNDGNARKASGLEKQVRELDMQLQHARVSSEASQEQQGMLYSAIWDMETLIDELKQKVAQSESRVESTDARCNSLSETNSEMSKELEFLRSGVESMGSSLNQATVEKKSCAEDISIRTSLIMDTVVQLAVERERIQNQLFSVKKENKLLRETLQKERKLASVGWGNYKNGDEKECLLSRLDSVDLGSAKTYAVNASEISLVEKSSEDASPDKHQTGSTSSIHYATNVTQQLETDQQLNDTRKCLKKLMFMAILVMLLSILAAHLFQKKTPHP